MSTIPNDLASRTCKSSAGGLAPLAAQEIERLLRQLEGWVQKTGEISKTYELKNYYETMAFVNALAWISHREDHHPDLEVGYKRCCVRYTTHAVGGLSENDFICAAKVDQLRNG